MISNKIAVLGLMVLSLFLCTCQAGDTAYPDGETVALTSAATIHPEASVEPEISPETAFETESQQTAVTENSPESESTFPVVELPKVEFD